MSRIVLFLLVLSPLSIIHSPALAQEKVQMVFEEFVDPAGELAGLTNQKTNGTFNVSHDLAKILQTTQDVANKLREPMAKKISVDLEKNQVTLKSPEVIINIEPVLKGYLADVIVDDMVKAGWQDTFLELQGIYVAKGQDFNGYWKIPVVDNTTANAHRAFFYKAFHNVAAATVGQQDRSLSQTDSDLKSVTVFTEEGACKAQGLAAAAYAAGATNAKKILKVAASRSVLVDQEGNFVQIPEEKK
ncbi:MAG: hypothetical protein A2W61_07535 [Deltaproteobacteria bacterium RIFCSPLOWO2_01_44_7]|nr:MAG: hypothetical protein A2W61_07535 [Deltaproteobacteria bacterium RIFCSPLOWO2_01_44_7]